MMPRPMLLILLALCCAAAPVRAELKPLKAGADGELRLGACHARLQGDLLRAGNGQIERAWRVNPYGSISAVSFRDLQGGREWVKRERTGGARATAAELKTFRLSASAGQAGATEEPSLVARLEIRRDGWVIATDLQIFAGARGILMRREARRETATPAANGEGLTLEDLDELEAFTPAPSKWTLGRVKFLDQTDAHEGPLVIETRGAAAFPLADAKDQPEIHRGEPGADGYDEFQGNLFFIEDRQTSAGLLFLKHAPLPHARPLPSGIDRKNVFDFAWQHAGEFSFSDIGIDQTGGQTYRWVTLAYQGGRAGRIATLQAYHRQLRRYEPGRDGLLLTNTWGDRSKDGRIREDFMAREIAAAARLGVDAIEIDDGWQKGATSNSVRQGGVWNGFYAKDADFWSANPERLPHGIKPLAEAARAAGMKFGLWFAPDSSDDFKNWEKDCASLLNLYRESGVNYFKFDGIKMLTPAGEANVHRLVDGIIGGSGGRVSIDLDVTAEVRPGYFGIPNHGPIFVENRYTDYASYWPHKTLRNFWLLAQYVDPVRLRLEFLNNARNSEKYGANPLAPATYEPDALFAMVMFASPLGWFETQNLPPSYFEKVAPLVKTWKAHREAIFNGSIIPVGAVPDGHAWTGFASVAADRRHGYALLFRELNDTGAWSLPLPLLERGAYDVQVLAGDGKAAVQGGALRVEIPAVRRYILVQLSHQ